ncbi:unnamed protein product, partial [Nesidiocoris tenuis]
MQPNWPTNMTVPSQSFTSVLEAVANSKTAVDGTQACGIRRNSNPISTTRPLEGDLCHKITWAQMSDRSKRSRTTTTTTGTSRTEKEETRVL